MSVECNRLVLFSTHIFNQQIDAHVELQHNNSVVRLSVSIVGNPVELVPSLTYLGCRIDACGRSEEKILRSIEITRGCMKSLTKNLWRSSITHCVKLQLYNTYVLPVLLYGSEMGDVTVKSGKRLDAFDQRCLRHILQVPVTSHVTNQEVRIRSAQSPVTQTITARRLRFFGHIVRSDSINQSINQSYL